MKNFSGMASFLKRFARGWPEAKSACSLALAISCLLVAAPALKASHSDSPAGAEAAHDSRFNCGYDPRGAEDEMHNHRLNALRLSSRLAHTAAALSIKAEAQDQGD